jgi:hypothetical protein
VRAALDGFAELDIHRWKADCMVYLADIEEGLSGVPIQPYSMPSTTIATTSVV